MNQKVRLLWRGQRDLDHHIAVLCHQLEEKLGLRMMFNCRQAMFLVWASDVESRVDKRRAPENPEEGLQQLEYELQAEVALKSQEVDWLLHSGSELAEAYENEQRKEVECKVQQVHDAWNWLQYLSKSRADFMIIFRSKKTITHNLRASLSSWSGRITALTASYRYAKPHLPQHMKISYVSAHTSKCMSGKMSQIYYNSKSTSSHNLILKNSKGREPTH